MAVSDALPRPIKNTAFRVYFPIVTSANAPITGWTGTTNCAAVSQDGAASITLTPVETVNGWGYLELSAAQMNFYNISITITVTNSGALPQFLSWYTDPAPLSTLTGTPQTGDSYARLGAPAGASIAADIATVKAKTDLITVGAIAVQSPVAANGDTTVYTSRDYSSTDSLALHYTMPYTVFGTDVFNWNINGATVTTGTYIDATHVDVAPTSAQLATLRPGDYDLEIEVIRSTRKLEPIKGKAHILAVVVA